MPIPESAREFMAGLTERARKLNKRIVFPEGDDPRVQEAAARLSAQGVLRPMLINSSPFGASKGIEIIDIATSSRLRRYSELFFSRRRAKGITQTEAEAIARQPLYFAALMLEAGDADGFVGGVFHTTADTVRAVLQCVGPKPGVKLVSSAFLMALHNREYGHHGLLAFADCAINIQPSPTELAEIAIATAETTRSLIGAEPAVALLSFSTKGSGKHAAVAQVVEALRIIRERAPALNVDGELQLDAAVSAAVASSKAPGSTVAGRANTLIFPNLAAGNIGYKLVERLAGAAAIGPVVQGLAKPANDLSRGCSAEDVFNAAVITALQAG